MFLTYKEISEVLNNLDKEYEELRKSSNAHHTRVGSMSLFVLHKVRKQMNDKLKEKYSE